MGASLAKDIPFAALYWAMLEPMRGTMLQLLSGDRAASGAMTPELGEAPAARSPTELLAVNIASAGTLVFLAQQSFLAEHDRVAAEREKALVKGSVSAFLGSSRVLVATMQGSGAVQWSSNNKILCVSN